MSFAGHRFVIALVGLSLGCGAVVSPSNPDAGAVGGDVLPTPDTGLLADVGALRDVAADAPGSCRLPLGGTCPVGQTCPAGDNCNQCACAAAGTVAMCTAKPCVAPMDAGLGGCRSASDCSPAQQCNFTAAGCGVLGVCGFISDCATIQPYCSCTGETFMDCPGTAGRAWASRGACATDGGAPVDAAPQPDAAQCAGASLGRGGSYCAGPADGPLPVTCCTGWSCDERLAACNRLPPTCPGGEVASVSNGCYGPCVPATHCAPIPCGTGCPHGWTCDSTGAVCRYPG